MLQSEKKNPLVVEAYNPALCLTGNPPEAVFLKQIHTAESSQTALTANPLATPVHMTEWSLAQHTCQHTAHHAYEVYNGVCATTYPCTYLCFNYQLILHELKVLNVCIFNIDLY